jgi:TRAP-type C4-dicarboxylate transport system permease small subunit
MNASDAAAAEAMTLAPRTGWPTRLIDGAAGLAAAAIVVVVLIQVVGRVLDSPVSWTEELTRAMFIWMVFLGMASSMRSADAARITLLLESARWLRPLAVPLYVAGCLAFFALMGWTGASLVRSQIVMNETIATLAMPSWVIGIVMPISAIVAAVATLGSLRDRRDVIATSGGAGK